MSTNGSNLIYSDKLSVLDSKMTAVLLPVTILIGVETVVGSLGNVLILIVYSKNSGASNSYRYFVLSLSIIDLTTCLMPMPLEMYVQTHPYTLQYEWTCKIKSYLFAFSVWGSATILSLLTVDRYRKICHALRWQIKPGQSLRICCLCIVVSSIVTIPVFLVSGKNNHTDKLGDTHVNVSTCQISNEDYDGKLSLIYMTCVYMLPVAIMIIAIGFLNCFIARKLFCKLYSKAGTSIRIVKPEYKCVSPSNERTENTTSMSDVSRINNIPSENDVMNTTAVDLKIKATVENPGIIMDDDERIGSDDFGQNSESDTDATEHITVAISRMGRVTRKATVRRIDSSSNARIKAKTIIMLTVTSVFIITMLLYIVLTSTVATKEDIITNLPDNGKTMYYLFMRMYVVNSAINPIVYSIMDRKFQLGLKNIFLRK